jgi:nucleoside-diphosphate kinase|tara:strand:- start:1320 stop:1766 length:447 start_codon:yes stop_codon:yes gene_type:complete
VGIERTLGIIKPDAVAKNFTDKILAQIEGNGLQIIASKMMRLSKEEAEKFYSEHVERSFYKPLVDYMTSGPVMIKIFEGENAITSLRNIMGATIPSEAKEGTIRNLYANFEAINGTYQNAIHGSDSKESAEKEINFFFSKNEINKRIR